MIKVRPKELKSGWLVVPGHSTKLTDVMPATEPREFASDPAFGDFNLPLERGGVIDLRSGRAAPTETASDISALREAIDEDDFVSYDDFRKELGL